ncbi:MAG TPA: amino acid ABC transporter permease, partial [Burkholderiaceae bacterium]|nr:amino acid ABC transporter permease [Burkholderiaceae bacterium]
MADIYTILRDNWLLLLIGQYPSGPLGGIVCTLILSVLGIVLAFPLSVLLALARISPWRLVRWPATGLVYLARGVPLLMVILWVYFLVPLVIGRNVSGFTTMLCTLVIYESAYLSEVVRAGIQALPKGQMEAARALGHSHLGAMWHVILPQALYNMLPSMLSQFISTIKETTLGYVINVQEMTF